MLRAGAGVADITAPGGTPLGGYWGRTGGAAGAPLDALTARPGTQRADAVPHDRGDAQPIRPGGTQLTVS